MFEHYPRSGIFFRQEARSRYCMKLWPGTVEQKYVTAGKCMR